MKTQNSRTKQLAVCLAHKGRNICKILFILEQNYFLKNNLKTYSSYTHIHYAN